MNDSQSVKLHFASENVNTWYIFQGQHVNKEKKRYCSLNNTFKMQTSICRIFVSTASKNHLDSWLARWKKEKNAWIPNLQARVDASLPFSTQVSNTRDVIESMTQTLVTHYTHCHMTSKYTISPK